MSSPQDYGILISQPGTAVSGSKPQQQLMNTRYPFIKIDTQNTNGFITLLLLITNDPPEPSGSATDAFTVVAKLKHGYNYIPSVETLYWVKSPGASTANTAPYFQNDGVLSTHSAYDAAIIYTAADATWVYFIVDKYYDGNFGAGIAQHNNLSGTTVQITTHVFVEDIGI